MSKRILKDFELETGIEIKNKHKDILISKDEFKILIKRNYITVKTEKGLAYLESIRSTHENTKDYNRKRKYKTENQ